MTRISRLLAISFAAVSFSVPAAALCSYNGVDNAQTTLRQEFADSKWAVRARVLSAIDGNDAGMPWTTYQLQIIRSYKGNAPKRLKFFTERNSGGFYMDRPWVPLPAGHDIGGEYLLFLNPNPLSGAYRAEKNSVFVNYPCGQSKPWHEVPPSSRQLLDQLSRGDQRPKT